MVLRPITCKASSCQDDRSHLAHFGYRPPTHRTANIDLQRITCSSSTSHPMQADLATSPTNTKHTLTCPLHSSCRRPREQLSSPKTSTAQTSKDARRSCDIGNSMKLDCSVVASGAIVLRPITCKASSCQDDRSHLAHFGYRPPAHRTASIDLQRIICSPTIPQPLQVSVAADIDRNNSIHAQLQQQKSRDGRRSSDRLRDSTRSG